MNPDIVVDVGNSRMKWGKVGGGVVISSASLPADDRAIWEQQLVSWRLTHRLRWLVAGVCPSWRDAFLAWLASRKHKAQVLDSADQLPLVVKVPEPNKVGIDRLLAAVGANARRTSGTGYSPENGAIVVGVGTAITVDLLDAAGVFLGGAIFPGPRLMALALHQHTAMLPLVEMIGPRPAAPATGTRAAIELGIHWAMVGGINGLIQEMGSRLTHDPRIMDIFVTGGGSQAVANQLIGNTTQCPRLVLEGICLAAAALP